MKPTNALSKILLAIALIFEYAISLGAQGQPAPGIENCDCNFKIDPNYLEAAPPGLKSDSIFINKIDASFKTQCGYLIVPENRNKTRSRPIKLPFIIVKSKNPLASKDPILFTTGGPGGSSLAWANNITKSALIQDRDFIAFEQRGTAFAIPNLRRFDLDSAKRTAYRENLSKDSMTIVGVKRYKKSLEKDGIDLSGYNTDETVADIHDLLSLLNIDSVNLYGGSYSGGLMLAVLQKNPAKVRSLVLDSPLPTFVPIDEDEPANFIKALDILLKKAEKDSAGNSLYSDLSNRFGEYFTSIIHKKFYLRYLEKGQSDTLTIEYTKNELLDYIVNNLSDRKMPFIITEIINDNHSTYAKQVIDNIFNRNIAPNGMRISVYCADQAKYHSEDVINEFYSIYPYMEGFHINDVYKSMCDCWDVPPIAPKTKRPYYSNKPVLIADGEMDQACSPLYMAMIAHYMPNAQCFLFKNRFHGIGGKSFDEMMQRFLNDPYKKIESNNKSIIPY